MKFLTVLSTIFFSLVSLTSVAAQSLYGVNPFTNSNTTIPSSYGLFYLNYTTGAITDGRVITVPSRTVTGAQALARDPTTGTAYAVVRVSEIPSTQRLLITLNLDTGVGVEVGNLGDRFSSLAFRSDGQLFGATGNGATVPETLYLINKTNAAKTLAISLGNGADGEIIAHNPNDNSFYHWSGSSSNVFFEKIADTTPYTITPIVNGTGLGGEVFGAVWDQSQSKFLVHDINSVMASWSTTGVRSNVQAATINDVRGMVLIPAVYEVPTLSEWGMILLALSMVGLGIFATRRRSAA